MQQGENMQLEKFVETIIEKNLRNSIFVDVTANEEVAKCMSNYYRKAVSVVACNKIAASSSYNNY